jgi:hypothetical protein
MFSEVYGLEREETERFYESYLWEMDVDAVSEISAIANSLPYESDAPPVDFAEVTAANKSLMLKKFRKVCSELL